MLRVLLMSSQFDEYTGGERVVEVDAANIRQLILALDACFPGMGARVETHGAIAVDGEIYQDAWEQPLRPDSEICLIPRIAAG